MDEMNIWKKKTQFLKSGCDSVEEYRAEISKQFDEIEDMMNKQMHLTHPKEVENKLYSVSYKWHFISEEDRDFYQGCIFALENGLKWS